MLLHYRLSYSYLFPHLTAHLSSAAKPHFMQEFLINHLGFSRDTATKLSKHLTHLDSPSVPESVIHFLKRNNFTDTHIQKIISKQPKFLCSSVAKTLEPKFRALQKLGFSESDLIELVKDSPHCIWQRNLLYRFELLKSVLITNENLLKALRKDKSIVGASLEEKILPNVILLREWGIPDDQIAEMVMHSPMFITKNPDLLKQGIKRVEDLGVSRDSGMFCCLLRCIAKHSGVAFDAKFKLLESLGWSKMEAIDALGKCSSLLLLSEKNIRDKMKFFLKEAGCELSYVVSRPSLFLCSLEKRLVPRHSVVRILEREDLLKGGYDLLFVVVQSEENFLKKFVVPYKEKVPGLYETYVAASSDKTWKKV